MKRMVFMLFLLFAYRMAFAQDEFEKKPSWEVDFQVVKSLDETDWNTGNNLHDTICRFNVDDRVIAFESGCLSIKAINTSNSDSALHIKEGIINTFKKHTFRYGKFDFMVKSSIGKGVWPAIWMVCTDRVSYPRGEIDIFEYNGCWGRKNMQGNIHYVANQSTRKMCPGYSYVDVTQFHLYTLEWTPNEIRLKVDGVEFLSYTKNHANGWIFDKDYYLIFNMAFGKGWGASCGVDAKSLPCSMDIAWIRYYKLKEE